MTKLQSLVEILQKDESIQGLDQLIVEHFYNQENNEYTLNDIYYFILTEDEVQDLLDQQFEDELYEASILLENKNFYEISELVQNINYEFNYLKAFDDADKVKNYNFIGKTSNYYIFQE